MKNLPKGLEFLQTLPKTRMLEEAFKLYGVREASGVSDNPQIMAWAKTLSLFSYKHDSTPWCFTGDIQILTKEGFATLQSVVNNPSSFSEIAQVDPDTLEISYTSSWLPVKKPYLGELLNIKRGNTIDFSCDPEHEFFGKWSGKKAYGKRAIKNITKAGVSIPLVKAGSNENLSISDAELTLLAAFLSDGMIQGQKLSGVIRIKVSKEHKKAVLDRLPFFDLRVNSGDLARGRKQTMSYMFRTPESFIGLFSDYKQLKMSFILSLSARQARIFIDSYKFFDGTQKKDEEAFTIFTGDKAQADNLLLLGVLAGYKASLYRTTMVSPNCKIPYLYNIYLGVGQHRSINPKDISSSYYEGDLFCVSVPSGLIVIKDRAGNIMLSGNCGLLMAYVCKKADKPECRNPLWALNWMKWGNPSPNPSFGDVLVFERRDSKGVFIGGHVGLYLCESSNFFYVLGGNTNDKVGIAKIAKTRLKACRRSYKVVPSYVKPIFVKDEDINLKLSSNEA